MATKHVDSSDEHDDVVDAGCVHAVRHGSRYARAVRYGSRYARVLGELVLTFLSVFIKVAATMAAGTHAPSTISPQFSSRFVS
jgi:hypothetical protein